MTRGTVLRLLVVVPLLAAGLALGGARPASAATVCGDTPSTVETLTGVIKDSIVVKANAICALGYATVRGGITVETSGSLDLFYTEIRGSVSGAEVDTVNIDGGEIRGSVTVRCAAT